MKSRAINGHDRSARAEARVGTRGTIIPPAQALAAAAAPVHGNVWQPVRGPHLRVVRRGYRKNRTGCVGISFSKSGNGRCTYFIVNLGRSNRRIRIETLGREEAWRRAVKLRAE